MGREAFFVSEDGRRLMGANWHILVTVSDHMVFEAVPYALSGHSGRQG
jgi:hypothetical protein